MEYGLYTKKHGDDLKKELINLPLSSIRAELRKVGYNSLQRINIESALKQAVKNNLEKRRGEDFEENPGPYLSGGRRRKHSKQTKRRKSHKRRRTTRKH
jgi:hypothetical protein